MVSKFHASSFVNFFLRFIIYFFPNCFEEEGETFRDHLVMPYVVDSYRTPALDSTPKALGGLFY